MRMWTKRLTLTILLLAILAPVTRAALNANTVWEVRTTGAQASGGGFRWLSLRSATYKWTASGSGTNEYYCEAAAGGDPSLTEAKCATTDGTFKLDTNGSMGTLNAGEWDWGDNDTLGYSTVYVRLDGGTDPDTQAVGFVQIGNGGGYDYSQQAAAQLSLVDFDHGAGSSTLTSATGGFTALMVGNIIHITSGTNFTVGWYEITGYTSSNEVTVDRSLGAVAGTADGVGAVGGAFLIGGALDDEFTDTLLGGNYICVGSGTYNVGEDISQSGTGTRTTPYIWRGYTTTRSDSCTGTDRALINGAGYTMYFWGEFAHFYNLRFTSTHPSGFVVNNYGVLVNCKMANTSGSAWNALQLNGAYHTIVSCEISSTNGTAVANLSIGTLLNCYVHDSVTGCTVTGQESMIGGCIFDTCTTGINAGGTWRTHLINNTIYNCTTGIYATNTNAYLLVVVNNIISGCTTGANWAGGAVLSDLWDYNCWNNTTNVVNVVKGPHSVTGDPLLTAPADGNFTLAAGSPCFNTGLKPSSEIGLP